VSKFPIQFYSDEVEYNLEHEEVLKGWLREIIEAEGGAAESLTYVFCSDSRLNEINLKYLKTNRLTDVIAFDLSTDDNLQGEIYISVERIAENAQLFNGTAQEEMHRVMAHGLLHLLGYADKRDEQKAEMTVKEDLYLSLLSEKI